jgi:hypothetical protein
MMPYARYFVLILFAALSALMMQGCASTGAVESSHAVSLQLHRVLVIPMKNMTIVYGEGEEVISPLSGRYFITGRVQSSADQFLTDRLTRAFQDRKGFSVVQADQVEGEKALLLADGQAALKEKAMLAELGRKAGVDAVAAGCIYRFEERVGTRHSIQSPAAVAFEVCLIRTTDGAVVWSKSHTETQASLSENLFELGTFLKRKARWITVEELASDALEEMMRTVQ